MHNALVGFISFVLVIIDLSLCFCVQDELIRQITINCAERGLLLLRVRDEARMTIAAYETLYESSIAYGIRKALMAEQKRTELDQKLKQLALTKRDLLTQVESLKRTIENTMIRASERREAEEKAHSEEVSVIFRESIFRVLNSCFHAGRENSKNQ